MFKQVFLVSILLIVVFGSIFGATWVLYGSQNRNRIISSVSQNPTEKRSLERYAIKNLRDASIADSKITFGERVSTSSDISSYMFYYGVEGKKVSGLAHVPNDRGEYPIIVMFRGYVPLEIYEPGVGTQRAGEVLAQNGYITLAPDFFSYGESDPEAQNPMEARFETYTTGLTLFESLENLNDALKDANLEARSDTDKVGIWGHSNGGHIAIVMLEVTGKPFPTTLWAPVSKPFPYSILYYTDESEDHGKGLRALISDFEKEYDIELYSPTNYLRWIEAPIVIHQGTEDDAVPQEWSVEFADTLEFLDKDVTYYEYQGDDHNLANQWNTVVNRDIQFFDRELSKD